MHIPFCIISAEKLDCMEGTPPISLFEDEMGVKLMVIIIIL